MKFEDLTPKMIEKAERCPTAEERMAFIAEHGIELTDQQLEGIAGGKSKKTRSTGYCPKSSNGKHNYVLTGRKNRANTSAASGQTWRSAANTAAI